MGEVIISDANEFDLPQIYEIERTSFPTPYPEGLLRAYLFIAEGLYLVAREDGQIKGYCIGVIQYRHRGHVISIATKVDSRRKGIGSMLLNEMENRFQILGSKYSYLEVDYKNIDAISFYRKHGYIVVGLKKNYYGRNRHGLIMIKPLPSTRVLES